MCARRSRRRPPEVQAALDRLKGEVARNMAGPPVSEQTTCSGWGHPRPGPPGDGPMVLHLLDLADRHLARSRVGSSRPSGSRPPDPGGPS